MDFVAVRLVERSTGEDTLREKEMIEPHWTPIELVYELHWPFLCTLEVSIRHSEFLLKETLSLREYLL